MSAPRPLLWPLVPLYAAALWVKEHMLGLPEQLHRPVLCVGSLSAGGAGKTPVVRMLVDLLHQRGETPVVLSRGYGRQSVSTDRVDPAGEAARFGDEPLLLARSTGAPVYVGADRYVAGLVAEQESPEATVFVLDDGFQHRGLARDLDIVLLTRRDLDDALLPAGNLREPLRALRRAHIVVLRDDEAAELAPLLPRWTAAPIWRIRRSLLLPQPAPSRPLAFCGIARPRSFFAMLRAAGCHPAAELALPDHHAYTARDLDRLLAAARQANADAFLTTEKDLARLAPAARARLQQVLPLVAAGLHLELLDADQAVASLLHRLHATRP